MDGLPVELALKERGRYYIFISGALISVLFRVMNEGDIYHRVLNHNIYFSERLQNTRPTKVLTRNGSKKTQTLII